jgi:hypothetical protein
VLAAAQHKVAWVVVKTAQRHAAEPPERALVAVEQGRQSFVVIGMRVKPARITQREYM